MPSLAISVSDLSKTYQSGFFAGESVRALDGVSLDVPKGTIFGLLGPNGAGKTTLVKILLGLVHPSAGSARLFGEPARRPVARERIGFLPENHRFPGFLTAEQTLHVYGRLANVAGAERDERIADLLDRVGLGDRRDTKVRTFSKGMFQRLGLAQALLNDPDLLFLDEPTAGVDPVGRRSIRDLVLELQEAGTTIFLNSHLLSEVEKVCSKVAILRDGQVVREGTIEELTAVERVYDLATTPVPEPILEQTDLDSSPADAPTDPALRQYRVKLRIGPPSIPFSTACARPTWRSSRLHPSVVPWRTTSSTWWRKKRPPRNLSSSSAVHVTEQGGCLLQKVWE